MDFGSKLRQLRKERQVTLRKLADDAGVSFTYLSKIENGRVPYTPSVEAIRRLAAALNVDTLELLQLAQKLPQELAPVGRSQHARRFFERARQIASPDDWDALLRVLERRQGKRVKDKGE